jgi:hypothetical protein
MDCLFVRLPREFKQVTALLKRQDWLISDFPTSNDELYNPAKYIYGIELRNYQYKIMIDRNIFRFIISSYKKKGHNEKKRASVALIYFCQAANIIIEPNIAIYERILPKLDMTKQAIEELILFYRIDSAYSESLLNYALGKSNNFEVYPETHETHCDKNELHVKLTRRQWLTEWKSIYVILLKIALLDKTNKRPHEKLLYFLDWLLREFRLSLPCIVFAIVLFSSLRIKKMNKINLKDNKEDKIKQAYNMTWDLFFINSFFRYLMNKDDKTQYLVATDDKVVKAILRYSLRVQNAGTLQILRDVMPAREHKLLDIVEEVISSDTERVYDTERWSYEYRDYLIKSFEKQLIESY